MPDQYAITGKDLFADMERTVNGKVNKRLRRNSSPGVQVNMRRIDALE